MATTRVTTAGTAMALLITAALLAGCSGGSAASSGQKGSGTPAVSATAAPSPKQSSGTANASVATIPDGTWVREVTTAEISSRGLDLSPEEIKSNYLDDGAAQFVLKTTGTRWAILVQDNAGEFEMGDQGDSSYDAQGRWVQSSDVAEDALLLVWKVTGSALTTSDVADAGGQPVADDLVHLAVEGTWQRQD